MLKDNFFSISRFMDLCRKDMVESWRTNLLRVGMMFGVMVVLFLWIGYFQYEYNWQTDPMVEISLNIFIGMGAICGLLAASFNMEKMKRKTSRLSLLMTPATSFEKFFSRWLISTIVYIVVFLIAFKLADYTRVLIYSCAYPNKNIMVSEFKYIFAMSGDYALEPYISYSTKGLVIIGYLFVQSCFVLGSSIWPKNTFIKTFVAGFIIVIVYLLIVGITAKVLFENTTGMTLNRNVNSNECMEVVGYIVGVFFVLLNWGIAYFRFKESEIINRL